MTDKTKRLLVIAALVAVSGLSFHLWRNSPVRAATRALLSLMETLEIDGSESSLARQGKAARLGRAVADPIDIKFQEAGREGAWSAESLQGRYAAGAMGATSISIEVENLSGEKLEDGTVSLTARLEASYSGQGGAREIDRECRWIMALNNGNWVVASFRETDLSP